MIWDICYLLTPSLVLAMLMWWFGRLAGIDAERRRVESLFHQAVIKRGSGSIRWVWNAVASDRKELMPEEAFFGPMTEEDRVKRSER